MHKLIVANYKMNGDVKFFKTVQRKVKNLKIADTELVLCPPFVYLPYLKLKNSNIALGSQDISNIVNNKSTGQISPKMLKEFNCKYAIVGHSERRALGENDEMVANKVKTALDNSITPIICVGENDVNSSLDILKQQVQSALSLVVEDYVVFAYEPVWAIGSGKVPSIAKINKACKIIKDEAKALGFNIKILYGGSVNVENYKNLLRAKIDGFLLGGVSLNIKDYSKLVLGVENE